MKGIKECVGYLINNPNQKITNGIEYSVFNETSFWRGIEGGHENCMTIFSMFEEGDWHPVDQPQEELLDGKFVCVEEDSDIFTESKVYEFKDGICVKDDGRKTYVYKNLSDFNRSNSPIKLEPCKPYLTIGELKEGKSYKCGSSIYSLGTNGKLYFYSDIEKGFKISMDRYNDLVEMKFTEVNPNQDRIDELKREIENLKCNKATFETNIKNWTESVKGYERDIKAMEEELKGLVK